MKDVTIFPLGMKYKGASFVTHLYTKYFFEKNNTSTWYKATLYQVLVFVF
jgi:hypothetical protein